MNDRYIRVRLISGDILDFDKQCNSVGYSDNKYAVFKHDEEKYYETLALIPHDKISHIEFVEKNQKKKEISTDDLKAFEALCHSLSMDFVLDEDKDFFACYDSTDHISVFVNEDGGKRLFDDRGVLFILLRSIANQLIPNLAFRNDGYILYK